MHRRETVNALDATVRCEQKRLQKLSETVPANNRNPTPYVDADAGTGQTDRWKDNAASQRQLHNTSIIGGATVYALAYTFELVYARHTEV